MRNMTTPSLADQVIEAFGGLTATAKALGHKHVTTVHGWRTTGRIPRWRYPELRDAAARLGKTLPPAIAEHGQPEAATAAA